MDGWAGGCTDEEESGWMGVVGGQRDEWAGERMDGQVGTRLKRKVDGWV